MRLLLLTLVPALLLPLCMLAACGDGEPATPAGMELILSVSAQDGAPADQDLLDRTARIIAARLQAAGFQASVEPVAGAEGQLAARVTGVTATEEKILADLATRVTTLGFHLVLDDADPASPPPGTMVLTRTSGESTPVVVEAEPALGGQDLEQAEVMEDQANGEFFLELAFNEQGGERLAAVTAANVGRRMAIVLDNTLLSAPMIQDSITGGRAQMRGHFSPEEAVILAATLQGGELPARVGIVESRGLTR